VSEISPRHAQQLFRMSRDLLVVLAGDGRMLDVNPSCERVLGHRPEDLIGRSVYDFQHPDDGRRDPSDVPVLTPTTAPPNFESRFRHADGHWVWLRWRSARDPEEDVIYGAGRDITAERAALERAQAAVRRMEDAQRAARVGSWEWDLVTGERHHSREMYAIQGLDHERDEPWGREETLARVIPEHHARLLAAIERMYREPGPVEVEYRMHSPTDRWMRTIMEAVRDEHGEVVRLRGTTQDITEMRRNERRLAEAERLADLGSFEWRVSDGAVVWSEGTYRLFGRDPALAPLTFDDLVPLALPEEAAHAREVLDRFYRDWRPWELEFSFPLPPGSTSRRIVHCRGEAYRSGDETYVRGTLQDVTEQRRSARQQQEIARLGQLALAGTDLKQLFDEVCRVTVDTLGTDMADVLALQPDGSLAFASTHGAWHEGVGGTAIAADERAAPRTAVEEDRSVVVPDWLSERRFPYHEGLRALGVRCTVTIPIHGRDGPWGVLTTHAKRPGIDAPQQNLAFMNALAAFLATAIERTRHETEIEALATLRGRLVAENLEAEERVRQRISEQLHDGALQDLLAARQDLVEAETAREDGLRAEMLGYARQGVERAVKRLREAVHALHPVVLQHGGLEAAMQAAADQAARQGSFRAQVTVDPDAAGLRDELVLSVARELLANAAKHAEADVVQVTVARQDGSVVLEVTDDGRGMDPEAVASAPMRGHIGLASLAQRVEAAGGTLDLGAAAGGRGTTVVARLPID
jgi:PAS domain S-box-containing protein